MPGDALRRHEPHQGRVDRLAMSSTSGPIRPEYWGHKTWAEVGPYAIGHGLGLTLHDRPFFNRMNQVAGVPEQTFREGWSLLSRPTPGARAASSASVWKRTSW